MKKLLLGVFLLAVLVTVSYLKITRSSERQSQAFLKGQEAGIETSRLQEADVDSLSDLIDRKQTELVELQAAMADTLGNRDQLHAQIVDSLKAGIDAGQTEIARLEKLVVAAGSNGQTGTNKQKTASAKASHKDILRHYRLAVAKFPADLSAYEYRVALAEAKSETAEKFKITVARLDQIREIYNLDY